MASVTVYKNSILATIVSIFGTAFTMIGVVMMVAEQEWVFGIVMMLFGIGLMFWSSVISDNKHFKQWKKSVEAKGLIPEIRNNIHSAISAYNSYPSKKTLKYIRSLNPSAAQEIERLLAEQNRKG